MLLVSQPLDIVSGVSRKDGLAGVCNPTEHEKCDTANREDSSLRVRQLS